MGQPKCWTLCSWPSPEVSQIAVVFALFQASFKYNNMDSSMIFSLHFLVEGLRQNFHVISTRWITK